jgi:hypothetical protein
VPPNQLNKRNQLNKPYKRNQLNKLNKRISKSRSRSPFAEGYLAGCIFRDMFFQFFTPQGLKCSATAIQCSHPGKVRLLAQQITENNLAGRYARVFCHILKTFECQLSVSIT